MESDEWPRAYRRAYERVCGSAAAVLEAERMSSEDAFLAASAALGVGNQLIAGVAARELAARLARLASFEARVAEVRRIEDAAHAKLNGAFFHHALMMFDEAGRLAHVAEPALRAAGHAPGSVLGKRPAGFVAAGAWREELEAKVDRALRGRLQTALGTAETPAGPQRYAIVFAPIQAGQAARHVLGVARNVERALPETARDGPTPA